MPAARTDGQATGMTRDTQARPGRTGEGTMLILRLLRGLTVAALSTVLLLSLPPTSSALAQVPTAQPGTEGLEVAVNGTGPVIATYQGNSATYSDDLYLMVDSNPAHDTFIFNNHGTPVGTRVNLGTFPVGTELLFRLHVRDTGKDYYTGSGSRNPDGHPHARAQADWKPNETLVSFEDLFNGPFNYNDLSFSFVPTTSAQASFCVGQKPVQFEITCYGTYAENPLLYFRLFFSDPDNAAAGFGFKGVNGSAWGEENHPFTSPSYGRVSPGRVDYPFDLLCGTQSAYESDVEAWIYNNAGQRTAPVTIHLACTNDLRNEVLNRARLWIKVEVPYNTDKYRDGYRTDCSGFVSYAWQLADNNGQPLSPDTVALGNTYTKKLDSFADLKPGDILNNDLPGKPGHVVIFVNWTDQMRTKFIAYDENIDTGATRYELRIDPGNTLYDVTDNYKLDAPGPFYPERYIHAP
jgi:hypothetical protein